MERLLALAAVLPFGLGFAGAPEPSPPSDEVVFAFTDPEIIESSGLVARDGLFATVNDSGDAARVFTVDPATGDTVGTTGWGASAVDIEALAPLGEGDVLVGDIGDNSHQRESITVTRVPMGKGDIDASATSFQLTYPDGPHDAESLLVHPRTRQVFVVAKEIIGRLYAAPEQLTEDGPNRLDEVGEVLPVATDGAFFPSGDHLVLRGYTTAAVYRWPSLEVVGEFDLPKQRQGEAIAVDEDGEVYLSSEGQFSEVLRIDLPAGVRAEVDRAAAAPEQPGQPAQQGEQQDDQSDGQDGTDDATGSTSYWPWLLGGAAGAAIIVVLLRSLRPR
jgi:hypothetical protein